jgi:hypothetical protein
MADAAFPFIGIPDVEQHDGAVIFDQPHRLFDGNGLDAGILFLKQDKYAEGDEQNKQIAREAVFVRQFAHVDLNQLRPHEPPQQPSPDSHGGAECEEEFGDPLTETEAAEKSFLYDVEAHFGHTTSSETSRTL